MTTVRALAHDPLLRAGGAFGFLTVAGAAGLWAALSVPVRWVRRRGGGER
jgi:hypothetical protein